MTFSEFLRANGKDLMVEAIKNGDWQSFLVFVRCILLSEFRDFGRISVVPKLVDTADKIGVV